MKDEKHSVIGGETLQPVQIMARFLKYCRYNDFAGNDKLLKYLNIDSLDVYNDMIANGQDMMSYMNKPTKVIRAAVRLSDFEIDDYGFEMTE